MSRNDLPRTFNVEAQERAPFSLLNWTTRMVALRPQHPVLLPRDRKDITALLSASCWTRRCASSHTSRTAGPTGAHIPDAAREGYVARQVRARVYT